jgi:hypothetical protein
MSLDLLAAVYRASPAYELVPLARVGDAALAAAAAADGEVDAVLLPRAPDGTPRGVNADTAALLRAFSAPAALPPELRGAGDAELRDALAALVAAGVLEVEIDGGFVSGPAARRHLPAGEAEAPLARLSREAVEYAAALRPAEPAALTLRLYLYNHLPLTPRRARRLASERDVAAFLGFAPGMPLRTRLRQEWTSVEGADTSWFHWSARGARADGAVACKLYLSPLPDALPAAFAAAGEVLAEHGALGFKVGRDAHGLLRPDKLVGYFSAHDAMHAAAGALRERLAGAPAHGVPFTAALDGDGLLSWGADPPRGAETDGGPTSWRVWVVQRLAASLARAPADAEPAEAAAWALERMRAYGVSPGRWEPPAWAPVPASAVAPAPPPRKRRRPARPRA